MKINKKRFTIIITLLLAGIVFQPFYSPGYSAQKTSFALIFLGGPDTGAEGETIITQFMSSLAKLSGIPSGSLQGKYFNNINEAKTYITHNKNVYIMASIGFFLSNRHAMNLAPLAVVKLRGNDKEQFYLAVKKGAYSNLKQLKGKTLSGNVLYEDPRFINTMIFDNVLTIGNFFVLKPTNRPLSAIRRLTTGQYDAVLLNHMQYYSLKNIATFQQVDIIHQSPKMPALGMMMTNTAQNRSTKDKIIRAVTTMCNQADTKDVCKNFGIDGFEPISEQALENEITKFNSSK